MVWLTALIAVVLFIWLLITFPGFRVVVLLAVVGLGLLIFVLIRSSKVEQEKSHSLIAASQLDLSNVTLKQSYSLWEVSGTVRNNSAYTLHDFRMKVTVQDCHDGSDCVVIGEENTFVWVKVPPSQLRAFKGEVFLDNMPKPKKLSWSYQIVETTAADQ
jgi:hypothetical protein